MIGDDPDLDHTGLDAGAVDTLLYFLPEERGKPFDRAGRHGYAGKFGGKNR